MIVIDLIYLIFFPPFEIRDFRSTIVNSMTSNNEFDVINIYKNFLEQ